MYDAGSRAMRRLALVFAPVLVIASDASIGAAQQETRTVMTTIINYRLSQ
jgi:hypothetical protein